MGLHAPLSSRLDELLIRSRSNFINCSVKTNISSQMADCETKGASILESLGDFKGSPEIYPGYSPV